MERDTHHIPTTFRKLTVKQRRRILGSLPSLEGMDLTASAGTGEVLDLSEAMIESAIGVMPVPLGLTDEFSIDGESYRIPMATEEPSVVAAASFAGGIVRRNGGFTTWATDPITTVQIFLEDARNDAPEILAAHRDTLLAEIDGQLSTLVARGGGARDMTTVWIPDTNILRIHIDIDVRDAMGANIVNTAAERAKERVESLVGGRCLMGILTNDARQRRAGARLQIPVEKLVKGTGIDANGPETARRIALASLIAQKDSSRAVTHNKGIMNGISALGLATGNDTRGIEASAHHFACRDGVYRGLSTFSVNAGVMTGEIELPLPFASIGGAVSFHPVSEMCLKMLGSPGGTALSRIAAALGLAQNLAALMALVTDGIQKGHMRLHAERVAYQAGARDDEIRKVADALAALDSVKPKEAKEILERMRSECG